MPSLKTIDAFGKSFTNVLTYEMPIDDDYLKRVGRGIASSKRAGGRLGRDWFPERKNLIEPQEEDDVWVKREDLKPLDDVCTSFCCKTFFPDARSRIRMVGNVIRLFDRLSEVCDLPYDISFKGGVMIRLILLQFWMDQPMLAREKAITYLKEKGGITMGDFDFEMSQSRKVSEEEKHKYLLVTFACLMWLQDRMLEEIRSNKEGGLLYLGWKKEEEEEKLKERVQEKIDSLPTGHALEGAKAERVVIGGRVEKPPKGFLTKSGRQSPSPRRNLVIYECEDESGSPSTCVTEAISLLREVGEIRGVRGGEGDLLYSTLNFYLNEDSFDKPLSRPSTQLRPLFHLSRIKHTFVLYYVTKDGKKRCDRLAGEMVDLSTGDPRDEVKTWKKSLLGKSLYTSYPLLGVPTSTLQLHSYSPFGFLSDLMQILHLGEDLPWENPKYEKRVVRYVALLFVCLFSTKETGSVEEKLSDVKRYVSYLKDSAFKSRFRTRVTLLSLLSDTERKTFLTSQDGKPRRDYYKTLSSHLSQFVDFFETAVQGRYSQDPHKFNVLPITELDYLNRYLHKG